MSWLLIAISAYFFLAIVFLVDKYLLVGPIPNPKVYAFYSGFLGILVFLIAPFVGFYIPQPSQIILSLVTGFIFVYGLLRFYKALQLFEPSRVVPAIGGLLPLLTFALIFIFSKGKETLIFQDFLAFILLTFGSVLIVYERTKGISLKSLKVTVFTALIFSFYMVFTKYVFLSQSFWNGLIWIRVGAFLAALGLLLFSKEVKEEILTKKKIVPKGAPLFLFNQGLGAGGNILLNWAIALAPLVYVAIINALQGIQYVFLLIFATLISLKFPKILKEKISKKILFQKIIAILLIGGGLVLLAVQ